MLRSPGSDCRSSGTGPSLRRFGVVVADDVVELPVLRDRPFIEAKGQGERKGATAMIAGPPGPALH